MWLSRQRIWLGGLLLLYTVAALWYVQLVQGGAMAGLMPEDQSGLSTGQIMAGTALMIWLLYGAAGLAGIYLARRAGLPGVDRPGNGLRERFVLPGLVGLGVGAVMALFDLAVRQFTGFQGFPHPPFPVSLLASVTAAIGEEILYRLFLMSLWVLLFRWLLRRLRPGAQSDVVALRLGNAMAALLFAAGHLGSAMALAGVATPLALSGPMLLELALLNGLVGWVCGLAFARSGLLAAVSVHFWVDIFWHVLYGLVS